MRLAFARGCKSIGAIAASWKVIQGTFAMEFHEIEKKAKGTDEEKASVVETLLRNGSLATVASVLLGFYLYDAVYSFDYEAHKDGGINKDFSSIYWYSAEVVKNTAISVVSVIAIEQYPAHLYVRGFRKTWGRLLYMLASIVLSLFIAKEVGGDRAILLLIFAYLLFGANAAEGYHRSRLLSRASPDRHRGKSQ